MSTKVPRTFIELKDMDAGREDVPLHATGSVWINGTEVAVEKDGLDIEYGVGEKTVVTLRLLPTELRFTH